MSSRSLRPEGQQTMGAGIPAKVALVTGGSSGIGRAAALALARQDEHGDRKW